MEMLESADTRRKTPMPPSHKIESFTIIWINFGEFDCSAQLLRIRDHTISTATWKSGDFRISTCQVSAVNTTFALIQVLSAAIPASWNVDQYW
jgi:hypothetical protein